MEDIGSNVHFLAKKGFLGTKTSLWVQKFSLTQIFLLVIEVVWRPNFMQKIRKKHRTVQAVGPEHTNVRTYGRTHESEFIGSFRSLKTFGEPIILLGHLIHFNVSFLGSINF